MSLRYLVSLIFKCDKVIVTGGIAYGLICLAMKFLKIGNLKVIYRSGGIIFKEREIAIGEKRRRTEIDVKLEYLIWKFCDYLIVPSTLAMETITNKYRNLKEKILLIPNYTGKRSEIEAKKIIFGGSKLIKILTIASLYKIKGLDILLTALNNVNFNFKLTIVGDGLSEFKIQLTEIIKRNKLNNNILFLKNQSDVEILHHVNNTDLYIQPSRFDVFPNAVIEAYCNNLPIVISKYVGSFREILDDKYVFVFDGSITSLRKLLNYICSTKEMNFNRKIHSINWDSFSDRFFMLKNILN